MNQLDLFLDGRSVRLSNALRQALLNEDAGAAETACRELADFDPAHRWLPHARTLIAALRVAAPSSGEEGLAVMARLEAEWQPAARAVLGDDGRDLLHRKWRGVAEALSGRPFDPALPDLHASYAYGKCEDWLSLERCVRAVPEFASQPVLLERIAEAVWRQRRRMDAMRYWFNLCWSAPGRFQDLMDTGAIPDPVLREGWERWQDQDLGIELSSSWFPAWMLIHEPKIADFLPKSAGNDAPQAAFDVLRKLAINALSAIPASGGKEIELRKQLQRLHPGLLKSFLSRR